MCATCLTITGQACSQGLGSPSRPKGQCMNPWSPLVHSGRSTISFSKERNAGWTLVTSRATTASGRHSSGQRANVMGVTAFGSHYAGSITLNPKHGWQSQDATSQAIDCAKSKRNQAAFNEAIWFRFFFLFAARFTGELSRFPRWPALGRGPGVFATGHRLGKEGVGERGARAPARSREFGPGIVWRMDDKLCQ